MTSQRHQVNLKNCLLQALSSAKTATAHVKHLAQDQANGESWGPNTRARYSPLERPPFRQGLLGTDPVISPFYTTATLLLQHSPSAPLFNCYCHCHC